MPASKFNLQDLSRQIQLLQQNESVKTYQETFVQTNQKKSKWLKKYANAMKNWTQFEETLFQNMRGNKLQEARRIFGHRKNKGDFIINSIRQLIALLVTLQDEEQYGLFLQLLDVAVKQMQSIMENFQSKTQKILEEKATSNISQARDSHGDLWKEFVANVHKQLEEAARVMNEIQESLERPDGPKVDVPARMPTTKNIDLSGQIQWMMDHTSDTTYSEAFVPIEKRPEEWKKQYDSALGIWSNFEEELFAKMVGRDAKNTRLLRNAQDNFAYQKERKKGSFVISSTSSVIALLVSLQDKEQYGLFLQLLDKAVEQMQLVMKKFQSETKSILDSRWPGAYCPPLCNNVC